MPWREGNPSEHKKRKSIDNLASPYPSRVLNFPGAAGREKASERDISHCFKEADQKDRAAALPSDRTRKASVSIVKARASGRRNKTIPYSASVHRCCIRSTRLLRLSSRDHHSLTCSANTSFRTSKHVK